MNKTSPAMHREIKITQRMLHLPVDLNYSPNSATN